MSDFLYKQPFPVILLDRNNAKISQKPGGNRKYLTIQCNRRQQKAAAAESHSERIFHRFLMNSNIKLVVFDWAGTTTDFGSQAPTRIFDKTFSQMGLHFTTEEINAPMGMEKKAHIRTMLSTEKGMDRWTSLYHQDWKEEDVEEIYQRFERNLREVVADYSHVIPGVAETVNILRSHGIRIGSTTGYNNEVMCKVAPAAAMEGYAPDCIVTPDSTGYSRPTPFMLYECMRKTGVYPASRVVKVGDTIVDILEGKNAGAWSVGILVGSSLMGLSQEEYDNASEPEIAARKEAARKAYLDAGADLVIDTIRDLPAAIEALNARMAGKEA